jgi:hypothetical protein
MVPPLVPLRNVPAVSSLHAREISADEVCQDTADPEHAVIPQPSYLSAARAQQTTNASARRATTSCQLSVDQLVINRSVEALVSSVTATSDLIPVLHRSAQAVSDSGIIKRSEKRN